MRIKKVLIVCVLLALPLSAKAQVPSADQFDAVREQIRRKLKDIPSISVAVARGDRIVWEEGFGLADKENKIAASPHTSYMLGSTSKPITATAVMTLRERGLVDLDRPINDYLGHSKLHARLGKESEATVRRVLQHMAGLPAYYETFYPDEPDKPPPLDLVIRRYGLLMLPPGERFHYSNLGYAVLGGMIAHVSANSFADFLSHDIFRPLGLNDSFVPEPNHKEDLGRRRAVRYASDGQRLPDYWTPHPPASDIYASAHDLALFGLFHLKAHLGDQKQILGDQAILEMQQSTVPMGKDAYGLGWHVRTGPKGRRHVLHGGSSAGVDAQLTLIPEEKLCVVVLANSTRRFPGAVTEYVTNAILASLLGGQAEDFPILEPSKKPDVVRLPDSLLGEWTGTVDTHNDPLPVKIRFQSNGRVDVQLASQAKTALTEIRFESSVLTGKMPGDVSTPEAKRRPYDLEWELTHRGETIDGILYAVGRRNGRGLRLGYWVQLRQANRER
ncbi:MAG TPA: serine hydrolase domain-containing protein [Gemmataceae bacterium]|nr:serine hydrolase domain-containing protein [Gemmataceae bacterium]